MTHQNITINTKLHKTDIITCKEEVEKGETLEFL